VLAAVVCGLQLMFWENATVASPEMLNLLLFAYLIRCLLEFRLDQRESWLIRFSVVYGAAIANDWAFTGYLPLFLVALIWIQGRNFFNGRFLVKMFLCGLAGLSLCLLLPLVQAGNSIFHIPFWSGLTRSLGNHRSMVGMVVHFLKLYKQDALLLALTSLIPILVISIRWASSFGDTSRLGATLTTLIFHIVHAVLFVVCIWVALDPPFSTRFSPLHEQIGLTLLTVSYLGAFGVGYFAGYFLLLFRKSSEASRHAPGYVGFVNTVVTGLVWAIAVLALLALLSRNLPHIRSTNGAPYKQFASDMAQSLPVAGGVVLSDDPSRLLLVEAVLAETGREKDFAFVETTALRFPEYQNYLKKRFPTRWPEESQKNRKRPYEDTELLQLTINLARTNELYYLHPSFGYYFEIFYMEPHGMAYKLQTYPTNSIYPVPPSQELIDLNQKFWTQAAEKTLKPLASRINPPPKAEPTITDRLLALARLKPIPNQDAVGLGRVYSQAVNYWGVEMQKSNRLPESAQHFELAQSSNPENLVARINLECNQNLQAGKPGNVRVAPAVAEEIAKYGVDQFLRVNGPYDESNYCYEFGLTMRAGREYRQSAIQFLRASQLDPNHLGARLALAEFYVLAGQPEPALKLVEELHAQPQFRIGLTTNRVELMVVEASAHFRSKDFKGAEAAIDTALGKDPENMKLLSIAAMLYMNNGGLSNAVDILDRELKLAPNDTELLVNKSVAYLGMDNFDAAIAPLTLVLNIENTNYLALLNRAIAYLRSDKLDEAKQDYQSAYKLKPSDYRLEYGLAEIAYRQKDTNAAVQHYELYLTKNPPSAQEVQFVKNRLKELKPSQK